MCGISGVFNYSNKTVADPPALVEAMNNALVHRGPDDGGVWADATRTVCLGHRRLSIIDLSEKGHQPMTSPRGNVIVFNGEIYNYKDIRASLWDTPFASDTDTEVILHLYDRRGQECLNALRGMFAFAVWDGGKEELFLARDRVGIKPLYYTTGGGAFAFSSEIRALLTLPWVKAELDEEALYGFLTFNNLAPPQTMFKGIFKFHPGHRMTVGRTGIRDYGSYWDVSYSDYGGLSEADLSRAVRDGLTRSVREHTVSDVPVGVFLSGGVDSSAITAIMSGLSEKPVRTFSIGFKDAAAYDERASAAEISREFRTEHHERVVTPEEIAEFLPAVVEHFDEPLADATAIPIYFLSGSARKTGTPVILTGDGGDELFCGYTRWANYLRAYPCYRMFLRLPEAARRALRGVFGLFGKGSPYFEIMDRAAKGQEFFWGWAGGFKESIKRSFLSRDFAGRMARADSYGRVAGYLQLFESVPKGGRRMEYIDWLCFVGLKDMLPNHYLYRADRLGMANSVEIRVPFLDHEFVNLAMSIPGGYKLHKGETKYILKRSLEGMLPRQTLYRRKTGFCVPLREWANEILLDYIDMHLKGFCHDTGLFDEEALRQRVAHAKAGRKDHTFELWNVYFLMAWFRRWMWKS